MRAFNKIILSFALLSASVGGAFALSPGTVLNVHIMDQYGAGVPGVGVAAVEFGLNGPSTYTKVGFTDSAGDAQFNYLTNTKSYSIYYSSQGYSPAISDQFNNPTYDPNRYVYASGVPVYSTFTINSGLAGVGRLIQEFAGSTPNKVLFGGVYNMLSQQQAGTGIVVSSADGTGWLEVDNVPFAAANTYNINLYDPALNKSIGRNVMSGLDAGHQTVAYAGAAALNFNQSIPPDRADNGTASGGASAGISVEGLVKSTNSVAIPHMGIGVESLRRT